MSVEYLDDGTVESRESLEALVYAPTGNDIGRWDAETPDGDIWQVHIDGAREGRSNALRMSTYARDSGGGETGWKLMSSAKTAAAREAFIVTAQAQFDRYLAAGYRLTRIEPSVRDEKTTPLLLMARQV